MYCAAKSIVLTSRRRQHIWTRLCAPGVRMGLMPSERIRRVTAPPASPCSLASSELEIRRDGDGLVQTRGQMTVEDGVEVSVPGTANIYIYPTGEQREAHVCCTRALKDLAVVWFTGDTAAAEARLRQLALFDDAAIHRMG